MATKVCKEISDFLERQSVASPGADVQRLKSLVELLQKRLEIVLQLDAEIVESVEVDQIEEEIIEASDVEFRVVEKFCARQRSSLKMSAKPFHKQSRLNSYSIQHNRRSNNQPHQRPSNQLQP